MLTQKELSNTIS